MSIAIPLKCGNCGLIIIVDREGTYINVLRTLIRKFNLGIPLKKRDEKTMAAYTKAFVYI
jgi:hypothetical protein